MEVMEVQAERSLETLASGAEISAAEAAVEAVIANLPSEALAMAAPAVPAVFSSSSTRQLQSKDGSVGPEADSAWRITGVSSILNRMPGVAGS
jgi:hypothetical protein